MLAEKVTDELSITDGLWIVIDADRFGMIADIAISGVWRLTACVSNTGADNAFETPEPGVWSPESPKSEGGGFCFSLSGSVKFGQGFCSLHGDLLPLF